MITSLLDTDLYKLTMQAVVLKHFGQANVEYKLNNRNEHMQFNAKAVEWLRAQILALGDLRFTSEEIEYLRTSLPYLPREYFSFLPSVALDPANEVIVQFDAGHLEITVTGLWKTCILYEIPILALCSEAYFKFVDVDWDLEGQFDRAAAKAQALLDDGCVFSEFGTRRRRSFETQNTVIGAIKTVAELHKHKANLVGTSNVFFAKKYDLRPIGTVAHELMMGVAAFNENYPEANKLAMDAWLDTVGTAAAGYALTDTFGTEVFLRDFVPPYSDVYWGVRQDSGDPVEYTKMIAAHYERLGYKSGSKKIIYSDSLNLNKCMIYKSAAEKHGLIPSFGIGTFFTNDFLLKSDVNAASKPLNIVMKLSAINGKPAVKLSDNISKNTGPTSEVEAAKRILGYKDSGEAIDEAARW